MKINVRPLLKGETRQLEFSHKLDLADIRLWGEYPFHQPAEITGCVREDIQGITLEYELNAVLEARCGRCLAPVSVPVRYHFSHPVFHEPREDALFCDSSGMLDTQELFESDLLPELPSNVLCREDCPGLCPTCGANLTEGACGCSTSRPDPRFDVLRKLIENDSI
ncbi:DUF177 domain-containing protein [Oscillospiraceae bacterium MB08-C2-2]|nr:DUF177 domain-containing protein [Oscillospiraceae bacterium MB08-C2-2]